MAKFIVKTTGQFGKDLKLAKKRGLDLNAMLDAAEAEIAAGIGTPHEEVMREMDEEIAHMEAEERAYWAQSVERDLADMAEGKTAEYVSGDEFWSRFEQAVETVFVDKILPSAMMTH